MRGEGGEVIPIAGNAASSGDIAAALDDVASTEAGAEGSYVRSVERVCLPAAIENFPNRCD